MKKKNAPQMHSLVGLGAIVIISIMAGALIWTVGNNNDGSSDQHSRRQVSKKAHNGSPACDEKNRVMGNSSQTKKGYKKVRISDGSSVFSFDVPQEWLVETRLSGEKTLTVNEMREFLATNYDGDIKKDPTLTSDYADYDWASLQKLTDADIQKEFAHPFPSASVSRNVIWYTDTSFEQIDFWIKKGTQESLVSQEKKLMDTKKAECVKSGNPIAFCSSKWSVLTLAGVNADVYDVPMDSDENGNEMVTKGGTGGKVIYVALPGTQKTLVISKQARGDQAFENDFLTLVETFKFE